MFIFPIISLDKDFVKCYITIMNWKDKRINAINRQIKRKGKYGNMPAITENYIDEHYYIINSSATNKEEYKAEIEHINNDYQNACLE